MTREIQIFNIQHFSVHDGPGTRTTIFFKGCPLSCQWCSNPESQQSRPELLYDKKLCQQCGACVAACPHSALSLGSDGVRLEREQCRACFTCLSACRTKALHRMGQSMTVEQLVREAERDVIFYRRSHGGVTLGGGEPLLQAEAAAELLQACRQRNLSTGMETSCFADWQKIEMVLPYLNFMFCDIKLLDPQKHLLYTGVNNRLILDNISRLLELNAPLTLRYPFIPGINDSPEDLQALVDWLLAQKNSAPLELLPYHRFGSAKYTMLNRPYSLEELRAPEKDIIQKTARWLRAQGINCINNN